MQKTVRILGLMLLMVAALTARAQTIAVTSPEYRSDVHGNTLIQVSAPGFSSPLKVKSWLPGGADGEDSTVAEVALDGEGKGSFTFRADRFPHDRSRYGYRERALPMVRPIHAICSFITPGG